MELLLLLVLTILGFSFYGFICFCRFLLRGVSLPQKTNSSKNADSFSLDETNDVHAAERLLRHLYLTNQLSKAQYMLRVRAFLFTGASFLFVAVIAMVSHAQQRLDHVWPWWAFGILTGAAILIMFGLFEKRRNDLIGIGKQMREWDG